MRTTCLWRHVGSAGVHVVVAGGGALGCAAAYHIRRVIPNSRVTIVERDPSYAKASSALSCSAIRQQFSAPVNIQLSLASLKFLREPQVREYVQFIEEGYLYLAGTEEGEATLRRNSQLQNSLGADIQLMTQANLLASFPWLFSSDIRVGSFGRSGEGRFDGFSLLQLFRRMALDEGAQYTVGEVTGVRTDGGSGAVVTAVEVTRPDENLKAKPTLLPCDYLVNACGAWARPIAAMVGIDLPVFARRRVARVFECDAPIDGCPLVIDPCGLYFRGDGPSRMTNKFFVGLGPSSESEDPSDVPLDICDGDDDRFMEVIWPMLAHRVPQFQSLNVTATWAGYYEVNPMDHNAIVGPHPYKSRNLIFLNGFSGHGLQHGYPAGRAVAEWIASGGQGYSTIDLSDLSFDRVVAGNAFAEENVI